MRQATGRPGRAPALEQYEATHRFLVETVLAETYPGA